MRRSFLSLATILLLALGQSHALAQTRDEEVHTDRDEIGEDSRWIYNDLPRGFTEAKQTGKPLLIVFR
jgi:hypothetical protein